MKKLIALLLAIVMVVALFVGCSGETEKPTDPATAEPTSDNGNQTTGEKTEINVGFSFATQEGSFWQAIQILTDQAAEDYS